MHYRTLLLLAGCILITSSCRQLNDAEIVSHAEAAYTTIKNRYQGLLQAGSDSQEIEKQARILVDQMTSIWFVGGSTISRALAFLTQDIEDLVGHAMQLQRRSLGTTPFYNQLTELIRQLKMLKVGLQLEITFSQSL